MKTKALTILSILLLALGCNKNDDSVSPVDSVQNDPPNETTDAEVLTGKFIDAEVQGLTFSTATQSGVTNENGEFNYVAGEEVTFKVGGVLLGKALGQAQITPITLAQDIDANANITSKLAQNIAAFLQTLDNDGDESNGITLTEDVMANLGVTTVDFAAPIEAVLADIVLNVVQNTGVELNIIYPSVAANAMANSLNIEFEASENLSLSHLIPTLKTYLQTWDRGLTPPTAVYRNSFDLQGNLLSIDILSRYSGKQFFKWVFSAHDSNGLPQTGTLTTYRANSLYGGNPLNDEIVNDISLSYNQDNQLTSLAIFNSEGVIIQTEQFTSYDDQNRPFSFFRDLGADDPNRDFTITWNFTYENGLVATADRIFDDVWVIDENTTYVTYTTRDFNYGYNDVNNLVSLDYTRVFTDESTINGENSVSSTVALVNETFNYDSSQKLTGQVITENVTPDTGDGYTYTITRSFDENELLTLLETSTSFGNESFTNYTMGIASDSESYSDGLPINSSEYSADGSSVFTNFYYDENNLLSFKETTQYSLDGIDTRTYEYFFNGVLDFTVIEEYSEYVITKSTGFNADGVVQYVDFYNEAGTISRSDVYFEGVLNYYLEYEYDANGLRTRTTSLWPDGEVFGINEFVYNEQNLIDTITYSDADGTIYLTDVYEYDENYFVSKITGYGPNGNTSYILFYEDGYLIREEIYDENGVLVDVYDYSTTGKRIIAIKNTKEGKSISQNRNNILGSSSDLDWNRALPNPGFSKKTKATIKDFNSLIEHRASTKIQRIRAGQ